MIEPIAHSTAFWPMTNPADDEQAMLSAALLRYTLAVTLYGRDPNPVTAATCLDAITETRDRHTSILTPWWRILTTLRNHWEDVVSLEVQRHVSA